jgi:putative transposase
MTQKSTTPELKVSSTWDHLKDFVRAHVQQLIQALLEEEVTKLLGLTKSARREVIDTALGYRNGYGKLRRLTLTSGTITIPRPRVRNLNEHFVSRVLPFFSDRPKRWASCYPNSISTD